MLRKLLLISALVAETVLVLLAVQSTLSASAELKFLMLIGHITASLFFISGLDAILPSRLMGLAMIEKTGIFLLLLFVPVLSQIGFMLIFLLTRNIKQAHKTTIFQTVPAAELPMRPQCSEKRRLATGLNLEETLDHSQPVDVRVRAIVSIRQLAHPKASRLLRMALKDPADDVRLLAYAILNQRETEIQQAIVRLQAGLSHSSNPYRLGLLKRLAQLHWQLIDQSLLHDAQAEQSVAEQAYHYAQAVLAQGHDRHMYRLLVHYYLRQGTPTSAWKHLSQLANLDAGKQESSGRYRYEWTQLFMMRQQLTALTASANTHHKPSFHEDIS